MAKTDPKPSDPVKPSDVPLAAPIPTATKKPLRDPVSVIVADGDQRTFVDAEIESADKSFRILHEGCHYEQVGTHTDGRTIYAPTK